MVRWPGRSRFDKRLFTCQNSGLPSNAVFAFALDPNDDVVMSSGTGNIVRFDGTTWTPIPTPPSANIDVVFVDATGILWTGSALGGLGRYDGTGWIFHTTQNSGLPSDNVASITGVGGDLWVGTAGGGLVHFVGFTWTPYHFSNSEISDDYYLYAVTIDRFGHIDTRWTPVGKTLRIELLGLSLEGTCPLPPEFGPAADAFFLDLDPGDYTLAFTRTGDLNAFHLSVTTSSISIDPDSAAFTRTQHPLRWRKPPRSFVCLCGTMTNTSWICEDFVNKLSEVVQLTESYKFPADPRSSIQVTITQYTWITTISGVVLPEVFGVEVCDGDIDSCDNASTPKTTAPAPPPMR